jgi:hypothetical protein
MFARPSSSELLEDETNLLLLKSLVSGESVSVNVNAMSRLLRKHRNTIRISIGGYNALVFSAHPDITEHMEWEQSLSRRFPECIGHVDVTYLSPRTKILIDQQKVSLGIIEDNLARVRGKKLRELVEVSGAG